VTEGDLVTNHQLHATNELAPQDVVVGAAVLRATGVVALLAVGAIHFLQIVPTIEQAPLLGAGYVAIIALSVAIAARLVVANDARAWAAAGMLSLAVLVGYAFTRVVGTTFDNQDVGNWSCMLGLASIFVEGSLLALSGAGVMLTTSPASERSRARHRGADGGKGTLGKVDAAADCVRRDLGLSGLFEAVRGVFVEEIIATIPVLAYDADVAEAQAELLVESDRRVAGHWDLRMGRGVPSTESEQRAGGDAAHCEDGRGNGPVSGAGQSFGD
jgi:hypothetical protein